MPWYLWCLAYIVAMVAALLFVSMSSHADRMYEEASKENV